MTVDLAQIEVAQRRLCEQHAVAYVASSPDSKTGFALTSKGELPINGLRHPPIGAMNGWFVWCGEQFSEERDFFAPLHTHHLYEDQPEIAKLLGLPPGYRFLLSGGYLDIWFDPKLLDID